MKFCLSNLKVAAKSRAARCVRLHDIIKNPWIHFGLLVTVLAFFTDAKEVATNTFYVKIHHDPNEPDLAHKIARRTGFHNLGPVSTILHYPISPPRYLYFFYSFYSIPVCTYRIRLVPMQIHNKKCIPRYKMWVLYFL